MIARKDSDFLRNAPQLSGDDASDERRQQFLLADADEDQEESLRLSPREREVIRLVAAGYPNKTIAGVLEISPWTVATYLRRLFDRYDVHSRTELIVQLVIYGYDLKGSE